MSLFENDFYGEDRNPGAPLPPGFDADSGCDRYALLLTALFDGEASATEEIAARAHMAECVRCAAMWRFWSQTCGVWRATPAARVPSGLLLRILMACRLAALRRTKTGAESQADSGRASAPREMHAPLAAAFEVPPVPPHLRDAILQRTVGAQSVSAPPMILPEVVSTGKVSWLSSAKVSRASRWASAVAVPAALVWMATVAGESPQNRDSVFTSAAVVRNGTVRTASNADRVPNSRPQSADRAIAGSSQATTTNAQRDAVADSADSFSFDLPRDAVDFTRNLAERRINADAGEVARDKSNESSFAVRAVAAATRPAKEVSAFSRPARTWPVAGPASAVTTQSAADWTDAPAHAEGVAPASSSSGVQDSQTARRESVSVSTGRPRIGLVRASFTPRISQPARGRSAARSRLGGAESFGREALLNTSTNAMRSRLRASDPLVDISRRGTTNGRTDDTVDFDAAFVADMSEGEDSRRASLSEADELRSIVNEYRATLMADEETSGSSSGTPAANESL